MNRLADGAAEGFASLHLRYSATRFVIVVNAAISRVCRLM